MNCLDSDNVECLWPFTEKSDGALMMGFKIWVVIFWFEWASSYGSYFAKVLSNSNII